MLRVRTPSPDSPVVDINLPEPPVVLVPSAGGGGTGAGVAATTTSLSSLTYYTNDSMQRFIDRYERALETRKKTQVNGWSHVRTAILGFPLSVY